MYVCVNCDAIEAHGELVRLIRAADQLLIITEVKIQKHKATHPAVGASSILTQLLN